jgi:cobalamin biosynthetic protein CobC
MNRAYGSLDSKAYPTATAPIEHGGRLNAARRRFPHAPEPWIDLSTGISPHAYPLPTIAPEAWTRLPDTDAQCTLESSAARAYCAPAELAVVAGPGTQAFVQALPRLFPARRVATLGFTYAEHAAAWRASGAQVSQAVTLDELAAMDVAIVVNPNNPDGRVTPPAQLIELARRMASRGGILIIDEAFVDFNPEASVAPRAGDNVIVLRSFGKAYGLPGVRLGFALCDDAIAARLRAELGPWSVSGPALAVGAAALADSTWLEQSRLLLRDASVRLDRLLIAAGFGLVGGTSLFRLATIHDTGEWFEHLGRSGILTRSFSEHRNWLRFGIPASSLHWERLCQALGVQQDV